MGLDMLFIVDDLVGCDEVFGEPRSSEERARVKKFFDEMVLPMIEEGSCEIHMGQTTWHDDLLYDVLKNTVYKKKAPRCRSNAGLSREEGCC